MKTIKVDKSSDVGSIHRAACNALSQDGLVCVPCNGSYRILADMESPSAVTKLMQSKRRISKSPSLVFVHDRKLLKDIVAPLSGDEKKLADALWPGPLTILFEAHEELPRKIVKQLAKANGRIGVRIPASRLAYSLCAAYGRPLLVSSANKEKKGGAQSAAQVRKNFGRTVDVFVDCGDLEPYPASTVIHVGTDGVEIVRQGMIPARKIHAILQA